MKGQSSTLGAWPRGGQWTRFELTHGHDGSFVLLSGEPNGDALLVSRFEIGRSDVTVKSVNLTTGEPTAPARTNQRGVHLLLRGPTGIEAKRVDWNLFTVPASVTLADQLR